ncbi:MAG: hypothetical protein ABI560_15550, partial [Myxococcales bacterium]
MAVESAPAASAGNEAVPPPPASAAVPAATDILGRIDGLHRRRDDPGALAEETKLVAESLARAPGDFEVLWRAAR